MEGGAFHPDKNRVADGLPQDAADVSCPRVAGREECFASLLGRKENDVHKRYDSITGAGGPREAYCHRPCVR